MVRHIVCDETFRLLKKLFDNPSTHDDYVKLICSRRLKHFLANTRSMLFKDFASRDRIIVFVIDNELIVTTYELKVFRLIVKNGGLLFHKDLVNACPSNHKAYEVRNSLIEADIIVRLELVNFKDRVLYMLNPVWLRKAIR